MIKLPENDGDILQSDGQAVSIEDDNISILNG